MQFKDLPEKIVQSLPNNAVTYSGYVKDIVALYQQCDILLAPIRIGGGTKYKILEAMATGLPVATTVLGAQGLEIKHMKHAIISDDVNDVIRRIHRVVSDKALLIKMTRNARQLIEESFTWKHAAGMLDKAWTYVV